MKRGHFEEVHLEWLTSHLKKRKGEQKGRLERGHAHGEILFLQNVWWPMFSHFNHLHGQPFYLDFAWLPGYVKIALEVKGFGPHVRDQDRRGYCNELNRETFLQSLGFQVVSIPYDDVKDRTL